MRSLSATNPKLLALGAVAALMVAALLLQLAGANPAASQALTLVAPAVDEDPGLDPAAPAWTKARRVEVPLTGQLGVYSAGGGTTPSLSVRALHFEKALYVRVEWADSTQDASTTRVEDFSDAVALEFPAASATSVPSFCMGQAGSGVNIWHWRADSQAPERDPNVVYTNSLVESYPGTGDLWYTALAAGNPVATLGQGPVQTLVAEMFGTLSPAGTQDVEGQGAYADGKWSVVFRRPFAGADPGQAAFEVGTETDMALAVWNGSLGERNGQKSVSTFIKLQVAAASASEAGNSDSNTMVALILGLTLVLGAAFIGFGAYGYRQAKAAPR
jgi:complex iron-sulfur molybdoenzyme family reductase subunit gamma